VLPLETVRFRDRVPQIDVSSRIGELVAHLEGLDGLVAAWIYGSYGTAWQTPLSDLDLALLFRPDRVPAWRDELVIQPGIAEVLQEEDVSVLVLNRTPVRLRFKVLAEGRRLLCRDPGALADFTERVLDEHSDFSIDYERFTEEYDRALTQRTP
jgi:uncharacterized protein